jgi:hypothetical protein
MRNIARALVALGCSVTQRCIRVAYKGYSAFDLAAKIRRSSAWLRFDHQNHIKT